MTIPQKYAEMAVDPLYLPSPWWIGHIPFATALIHQLRPRTIVELGTYSGASFFAFCQAVKEFGLDTTCFGIDLWEGDIHMGAFEDSLYDEVVAYKSEHYPEAVFIRKYFDDAATDFEEGTIDLLHIDGTHTYEAVSNDYRVWLPKLSDRGVVLFHDTNVTVANVGQKAKEFGVKRLFYEVKEDHPHMEFPHCFGLGVLVVGRSVPAEVLAMVEEAKEPEFMDYFVSQGNALNRRYDRQFARSEGLTATLRARLSRVKRILFG